MMALSTSLTTKAETYFKADVTSSNLYLDLLGGWATYGINKAKGGIVCDNYLTLDALSISSDNAVTGTHISSSSKNLESPYSFKVPNLFNGLGMGVKWGYKKELGTFAKDFAVYGSLHARYNYYIVEMATSSSHFEDYGNSVLKLSPGAGANVTFGKDTSPVSVMLDFNLKYDIPVLYHGEFGDGAGCLNSGLTPRISLIVGGPHLKKLGMNVGIFYEWSSYDLFKSSEYFVGSYSAKTSCFGINFTMFPWK